MTPFETNYRERVAKAREQGFDVLADYLEKRRTELEVRNPKELNGIHGIRWQSQSEGGNFWMHVNNMDFAYADDILREQRPELYGTPEPKRDNPNPHLQALEIEVLKMRIAYLERDVQEWKDIANRWKNLAQ